MEYVYAAMLLHAAKKEISEKAVHDIVHAAGISPDAGKIKALVASLKDLNIDEAIKTASVSPVMAAPAAATPSHGQKEAKHEEEDKAKSEEAAAEGLSALFG